MKIGCCIRAEQVEGFKIIGEFDFLEIKFNELESFSSMASKVLPRIHAVNNVLDREVNIFDLTDNDLFLLFEKIFLRCRKYGIKYFTLGSGKSRILNNKDITAVNIKKWKALLMHLEEKTKEFDMRIGIEPLAKEETNFINNLSEALYYIDDLKLSRIGVTLDSYHFFKEKDDINILRDNIDKMFHFHIADDDRGFLTTLSNQNLELIRTLRSGGYKNEIAIEIDWRKNLKNDSSIIKLIKNFYEER